MKTFNSITIKNTLRNKVIFTYFVALAMVLVFTPAQMAEAGSNEWSSYGGSYETSFYEPYGGSYETSFYEPYGGSYETSFYEPYSSGSYETSFYEPYQSYSSPSYDYSSYSAPSYSYDGYGGGGYSYAPSPVYDYVYNTPSRGGTGGGSSAPQMQYVYSSNTNNNANANANDNTNTNTITNTFNPTNNNDARINLVVYGGGTGTGTNTNTQPALNGNCVINPTVGYINQDVSFSASASGGNGSYSYSWTGDNGINSNAQNFTGRYSYTGYKTATVTIRSGSDSITRTCGVNIQGYNVVQNTQSNVTVIRDQNNLGTPVSGVFLSQVPETGVGFGFKMTLFSVGLVLWSLFAAYMISRKRNGAFANKINAFKLANMQKKGIHN